MSVVSGMLPPLPVTLLEILAEKILFIHVFHSDGLFDLSVLGKIDPASATLL